jgi:predicted Fe-Mo cluster-binding NifX family protein
MKVIVPSQSGSMGSNLSPVFGRCPIFMVVEIEGGKVVGSNAVPNDAANQQGGAGVAAAQAAHDQGAGAIIAGTVGPKAFGALESFGIDVYNSTSGTVQENIDALLQGKLSKANPGSHAGFLKK